MIHYTDNPEYIRLDNNVQKAAKRLEFYTQFSVYTSVLLTFSTCFIWFYLTMRASYLATKSLKEFNVFVDDYREQSRIYKLNLFNETQGNLNE